MHLFGSFFIDRAVRYQYPPNAETGSPAKAAFQASTKVSRDAKPQALLCFNIANVVSSNSEINDTAASMSNKLL